MYACWGRALRQDGLDVGTHDRSCAFPSLGMLAQMTDLGGWVSGDGKEKADPGVPASAASPKGCCSLGGLFL